MKKRFITRKRKKFRVLKIVLFLAFSIGSLIITFHLLNKSNIIIGDKRLVEVLLQYSDSREDKGIIKKVKKMFSTPVLFLDNNYFKVEKVFNEKTKTDNNSSQSLPTIYIYNSHQGEEYAPSSFAEYSVSPTVMFADYVLEGLFKDKGYISLVEEGSIKEILNRNGWRYSYSYMASRILMEEAFKNNPSLKYFIDVHRDSLDKSYD